MTEPNYASLSSMLKDVYGHGAEKRHRRRRGGDRPRRASIFANLTEEQQVLWDVFAASVPAGQTARIRALRSRRMPLRDPSRPDTSHAEWCADPEYEHCECGRGWEVKRANADAHPPPTGYALDEFGRTLDVHWTSPAQTGRRAARQPWQTLRHLAYESPLLKMLPRVSRD